MAIALRSLGAVQVNSSATSSTFSVPKPTGLAAGDLMLASVTTNGVGINLPAGWTSLYDLAASGNPNQLVCYKIADTADASAVTFDITTSAATYGSAEIGAYSGVDGTTPIDFTCTPIDSAASLATFTLSAAMVVTDGAVLVGAASANTGNSSSSWTIPTGWTDEWNPATGAGGAVSGSGNKSHVRANNLTALTAGASTGTVTFTLSVSRAGSAWFVGLRPGAGGGGGAPAPVLSSRIVGIGDDATSGRVAVRVSNATLARLKVGTDTAVTTGVVEGTDVAPDANGNAHLTVTGLTAGTKYYYRIVMTDADSVEHDDTATTVGSLRTAPVGATSFNVDFGSCTDSTDSNALAAVGARDDDLFLHLGDLYYADGSGNSLTNFRSKMVAKITATHHQAVMATRPFVYIPSDHDGMNNNSTAFSDPTAWTNWNTAYREFFPTPALPGGTTGCYYTFTWGRVRFIVTDSSSFKGNPSATESSSKTGLGTTQKQWIKDTITAATELLIVIVNAQPWIGSPIAGDDSWLGFTTERTEMANFYSASGKNIVLTGGDQHCLAADDGTNSPGGVPIFHAAPFNNTASRKGGPYTAGQYPASGSSLVEQYGRFAITDDGNTLELAYTGYDSSNTAHVTLTKTYTSPVSAGSASGSFLFTGAANGTTPVAPPTMPVGDLAADSMAANGWQQTLAEDFDTNCAEGSFLSTYSGWFAYPDTWDNGHTSYYNGGNSVSVNNSLLSFRLFTDGTGKARTETLRPPPGQFQAQKYGIFEVAYRVRGAAPGYKQAFLLWPESNDGNDGEIDFPEASFDSGSTIKGFVHEIEPPGLHTNNAYSIDTGADPVADTWHVTQIRWHDNRVEFWLDGSLVGTGYTSSVNVPDVAMGWRLQTEGNLTGTFADPGIDPGTTGVVDIAYVAMYSPVLVGEASGSFTFDGSASGTTPAVDGASGSASGSYTWTGGADGTAPAVGGAFGSASGAFSFSGGAEGHVVLSGAAEGTWGFSGEASGPSSPGTAEGSYVFVGEASGATTDLVFTPPTHEEPMRTNVAPLCYYRLTYANSIVRINGVLTSIRTPSAVLTEAAGEEGTDWFRGGHIYHVTDAVWNELVAAGFAGGN